MCVTVLGSLWTSTMKNHCKHSTIRCLKQGWGEVPSRSLFVKHRHEKFQVCVIYNTVLGVITIITLLCPLSSIIQ